MEHKDLKNIIELNIKREGLIMTKLISSASYGIFYSRDAVYDKRTAYSFDDAIQLGKEGFKLDISQDIGVFLLNALMNDPK